MLAGSLIFSSLASRAGIFRLPTFSILGFYNSINERTRLLFLNNQRKRAVFSRSNKSTKAGTRLEKGLPKFELTRAAERRAASVAAQFRV
jgi:hypothetical protein